MTAQPAWFHRLEEILSALRAMTSTHLDRAAVEKLVRLCQRHTRQIMAGLEGLRVGNAAAVSREALIARLERTAAAGVFQWEGNRRTRVVEALDLARRQRSGGRRASRWPSPPVYVIAALQDDLRAIKKAARKGTANKLITTYLWRAFLTDRYEAQANDRLFEDFKGLQRCREQIKDKGNYADPPVIFNDTEHSLPTAEELTKPLQWIRRKRLGRAVAAITMRRMPRDWVTGDTLDANTIRTLEDTSNLERHHVFPREFLKAHCTTEEINHGLNGVLLTKGSNRALSKKDPARYLQWIRKETKDLSVTELRSRVESHLVPYDALKSAGTTKSRYKNFLKKRAQLVAAEIAAVAAQLGQ